MENIISLRLIIFIVGIILFLGLGIVWPFTKMKFSEMLWRWVANSSLTLMNLIVLQVILGGPLVIISLYAKDYGVGIFNLININYFAKMIVCLIFFDFIIYWQHRLFHKINFFWRFHRVHHSDMAFDTSTALRFHPFEAFLSVCIKAISVLFIGAEIHSILIFEIILNFSAMFNHGNFILPNRVEKIVGLFFVTPNQHRTHHLVDSKHHHRQFAFCLSIWDRFFDTHILQHEISNLQSSEIGLSNDRDQSKLSIWQLVKMPFN